MSIAEAHRTTRAKPEKTHYKHLTRDLRPLFIACQKGHAEVAQKLLDAGADPHMARDDGAIACGKNYEEFAGKNHT